MTIDLFNKGEANFYTCDVTANKQIRENFLIVNQISDDVCVNKTESTLIQRFGTICSSLQCDQIRRNLKIFGKIFWVFIFVFGKMLNGIWQISFAIGQIFNVAKGQNRTHHLVIW